MKTWEISLDNEYKIHVQLFPNRKAFLRNGRRDKRFSFSGKGAIFASYYEKDIRTDGVIGAIKLYEGRLLPEVISHEAFHAVLALYRRKYRSFRIPKKHTTNPNGWEERVAHQTQYLAREILDLLEIR